MCKADTIAGKAHLTTASPWQRSSYSTLPVVPVLVRIDRLKEARLDKTMFEVAHFRSLKNTLISTPVLRAGVRARMTNRTMSSHYVKWKFLCVDQCTTVNARENSMKQRFRLRVLLKKTTHPEVTESASLDAEISRDDVRRFEHPPDCACESSPARKQQTDFVPATS